MNKTNNNNNNSNLSNLKWYISSNQTNIINLEYKHIIYKQNNKRI
jgi:hypothetical protein